MKVLILTTRIYKELFISKDWQNLKCDRVHDFLQSIKSENIFGDQLSLLKCSQGESCFYAMPCVPKEQYDENASSKAPFYGLKNRQDYVDAIIEDVMKDLGTQISSTEIWLVAHDRDFINQTIERPLKRIDLVNGSNIISKIEDGIISIDNIYLFQHNLVEPREWRVFAVIEDYLSKPFVDDNIDVMGMFIKRINTRKEEFKC